MAGGTSQYALKNMADGFGVTTKAVTEAEKEYRKGEMARKASIDTLKQAQRAEAIGDSDKILQARDKHEALVEKAEEHNQTAAGLLLGRIGSAELSARTAKEGRLGREATAKAGREANAMYKEIEAGRRESADRDRAYAAQSNIVTKQLEQLEKARKNAIDGDPYAAVTKNKILNAKTPKERQEVLESPAGRAYTASEKKFADEEARLRSGQLTLDRSYGGLQLSPEQNALLNKYK